VGYFECSIPCPNICTHPKYYSPYWLAQPTPGGGVRRKPHTDLEVQNGYMLAMKKLVLEEEECAQVLR
jgi:hypothetical protein